MPAHSRVIVKCEGHPGVMRRIATARVCLPIRRNTAALLYWHCRDFGQGDRAPLMLASSGGRSQNAESNRHPHAQRIRPEQLRVSAGSWKEDPCTLSSRSAVCAKPVTLGANALNRCAIVSWASGYLRAR